MGLSISQRPSRSTPAHPSSQYTDDVVIGERAGVSGITMGKEFYPLTATFRNIPLIRTKK